MSIFLEHKIFQKRALLEGEGLPKACGSLQKGKDGGQKLPEMWVRNTGMGGNKNCPLKYLYRLTYTSI